MKIASVVVTYNRKELLLMNVMSQLEQTLVPDRIIIIDNNSDDGTDQMVREKGWLEDQSIEYIKLSSNTGGAGGFSYGTKHAYEEGYDFIILMDDDGRPYNQDTIKTLVVRAEKDYKLYKTIYINSLVTCDGVNLSFPADYSREEIETAQKNNRELLNQCFPFNCTLISREVVEAAGVPRADFFMSCDEREFTIRCRKNGVHIATEPNSIYLHPKLRDTVMSVRGFEFEYMPNIKKEYYYVRNSIVAYGRGIKQIPWAIRLLYRRYLIINQFEDNKTERKKLCRKAFWDGLFERMGKRV